jgi:uncharacterized protein YcgI (DUF1989 family)
VFSQSRGDLEDTHVAKGGRLVTDPRERAVVIPAGEGRSILAPAGTYLSVVDLEGAQVADFMALQRADLRKAVSPHQTRSSLRRLTLRVGDSLGR